MMKNHVRAFAVTLTVTVAGLTASAQIPAGYYDSLKGKKGAELKNAVHEVIKKADVLGYGSGSGKTWEGFYTTDRMDDNSVVDRYSNDVRYFGSKGAVPGGMNIEHSFPKSWWGGSNNQAYKDLYNLMPCEQKINSSKSNYPMGKVTAVKTDNGCTKVGTGANGYQLWEPADKWKGDFARGYMYMATTYQNLTWQGTQALQLLKQGAYPTLQEWASKLYLEWARTDVVDRLEVERNEAVSRIQGNRNPFVDFPNLMEYIWGDSIGYAFDPQTTVTTTGYTGGGGTEEPDPDPGVETIFTADFTAGEALCTIENTSLPYDGFTVWRQTADYGWKATAYASDKNNAADASVVTPDISLAGYGGVTLSFSHAANYFKSPSGLLAVEVRCDGQTAVLDGISWPSGNNWTFRESGDISLDAFAGKTVRVAFRYRSTGSEAGTWEVKSMRVSGVRETSGISSAGGEAAVFDPSEPFEAYTVGGSRVSGGKHRGLVIIRQNGHTWKTVR